MWLNLMDYLVVTIGAMSFFDLYCTLKWIIDNPYMEANPIMRYIWFINPILFILFKILTTILFCIIAFKFKSNKLMRRLIWLPFCAYLLTVLVHFGYGYDLIY